MRRIALLVAACATFWLTPASVLAQRSTDEDQIRGWYRDYLGREVGPELTAWLQLLRGGMSSLDLQAAILGSDEYYAQAGRDPQIFVTETLQAVNWAQPSTADVRRWTDRLTALRGDRLALAREILQTYGQQGGVGVGTGATADPSEIAGRLVAAAKLLGDTLDFEIGGTLQGRQARQRSQALYDACDQLRRIVAIRTYRPTDAQYALQDAQRAFAALQTTLSNPPGTAPSATNIVRRVSSLLAEMQLAVQPTTAGPVNPTYPPSYPYPGTNPATPAVGYDQKQFLAAAESISRGVQSIIQSFSSQASGSSYGTSVVLRDLDTFAARVDDLIASIRRGTSAERLHWEVDALSEQAARIGPPLLAGRPPQFTKLFWSSVEAGLAQMAEPLGHNAREKRNTGVVGPGGSVVLRPTPINPRLVPLVDQALSKADVFLTGTQPLVFGVPEIPRVQRDVRNIKSRLLELRQEAQDGQPATTLKATLQSMVADYQAAYSNWGQIVTTYRLLNPPRLSPVGETLNQVEQILNQAAATESLTPAYGSVGLSHVAQLLGTIGQELRQYREALPSFAAYNEHRALLVYLDQLDDYLATINDAQRTPATAYDVSRRQAAGMQRVVGLVSAQADSLAARVQAAGTRDLQRQARNLQNETNRLADLVDDLESELH